MKKRKRSEEQDNDLENAEAIEEKETQRRVIEDYY